MDNRALIGGMALGAAAMLMLDPDRGARRRALVREKMVRGTRRTGEALDAAARDVANRTRGVVASTRGRVWSEDVEDDRLLERVRAKLGRVCSHPHAVDVDVMDGAVTLRGPILADEVNDVLTVIASVRGVHSVHNGLDAHDSPEGIPALQGEGRVAGSSFDLLQPNWAPGTQAIVGIAALAAGGLAMAYARR